MTLYTILAILAGFLFSALFSGVETGSYMINRSRLRHSRDVNIEAISAARRGHVLGDHIRPGRKRAGIAIDVGCVGSLAPQAR